MIVRRDLLDRALPITPSAFHWKEQAENDSMLNTPPTYAIYIAGLVFEWLLAQGGLAAIEQNNIAKATLLYDYLDSSGVLLATRCAGGPLAHERAVQAARRSARQARS